jgi:hypothetical protein
VRSARRDRRALRRRCEQAIARVAIPDPFDLESLCEAVSEQRGRRLRITVRQLTATRSAPCGMWIAMADEDVIVIEQHTSSLHQDQIGLHEIGHILCDHHESGTGLARRDALRLLPSLDPQMVQRVLGRTSYDLPQEQEAEMVATLLGERIRGRNVLPAVWAGDPRSAVDGLGKLTEALGGRDV